MKRRVLSIFLAFCLVLVLLPSANAANGEAIAKYEDSNGNVATFYSVDEIYDAFPAVNYAPCIYITSGIFTLLNDISIELNVSNYFVGFAIIGSGILDLNGHTITFTGAEPYGTHIGIMIESSQGNIEVKNGTLLMDVDATTDRPVTAITATSRGFKLENLSLLSPDGKNMTYGLLSSSTVSKVEDIIINNCVIDAGNGSAIEIDDRYNYSGNVSLASGSYQNLTNNASIVMPANSSIMDNLPEDVDDNTTVITSPATTAMIVKDGNAYLYDTLQDAVNAVDADGTIYLLKQPSDEKVTVPEDAGFRIVPFGDGSEVDTGKLQLVTASGNKASVDEDGYIVIEQPWIVTLDNGKGAAETYEVIKGQPFTFPAAPSKPGYIFLGWRGADGRTYNTGDVVEISGNTTFKAIWGNLPDVTEPSEPDEPVVPVFPFNDVTARDWYYSAVRYVYEKGLMDGVDVGVFAPDDTLTRAMVWKIIARAEGVDTTGGATWYAKAQEYVTAKGISDGENPNAPITREQLVTMLYRLAGEPAVSGTITAPDAASVSSWAKNAMTWAMSTGLIEGDENGAVTPTATATRAQAAAIFMRFIENIK